MNSGAFLDLTQGDFDFCAYGIRSFHQRIFDLCKVTVSFNIFVSQFVSIAPMKYIGVGCISIDSTMPGK